jgi:hypothetical protein
MSTLHYLTNVSSPTPNQPNWHPPACTLQTCPLTYAYLMYNPNLGGNVLFLTIFALLIPAQLLLGYHYRTPGFTGTLTYFHRIISTFTTSPPKYKQNKSTNTISFQLRSSSVFASKS